MRNKEKRKTGVQWWEITRKDKAINEKCKTAAAADADVASLPKTDTKVQFRQR